MPVASMQSGDDDLNTDQLQCDVGHCRNDPGDRDRQGQPFVAVPAAHEIRVGDVAMPSRHRPQARKHDKDKGIHHDRVGHREKAERAGAEQQCRDGDKGVCGVEVATEQKPGNYGAKAAAGEPPFMQQTQVSAAPARSDKTEYRDQAEEQDEDDKGDRVDRHEVRLSVLSLGREIDDQGQASGDRDPQQLVPIEERHAVPGGLDTVVARYPEHRDERQHQQRMPQR